MAVDKKMYAEYIEKQSEWQGHRIPMLMSHPEQLPNRDIIAAAITASVLQELKYLASAKPLNQHDVQAYLDGFLKAAGMSWGYTPMGAQQLERIADKEVT